MAHNEIDVFLSRTTLRQIEIMSGLRMQGSISRTAEELGMSVANVSRVSGRFEANIGVKLFQGDGRRFHLSPEGERILDHLLPLMSEILALRDHLKIIRNLSDGHEAR